MLHYEMLVVLSWMLKDGAGIASSCLTAIAVDSYKVGVCVMADALLSHAALITAEQLICLPA
jgi:hypothetical protein